MQIDLDLASRSAVIKMKRINGKPHLFDAIRMKWLILQPEEVVRQLMVDYLIDAKGFNKNRIRLEQGLSVNGLHRRCDILVYDTNVQPWLMIECKSAKVPISQAVFRQIANYNLPLGVPYLVVTNGPVTYCCRIDKQAGSYTFLPEIPVYGNW